MTAVDDQPVTTAAVRSTPRHSRRDTDHTVRWIALAAALLSIGAYAYFASRGMALGYRDSISHLQIAARTLDSPTAGFGQLGGVWLPLPHVLMLPLVWIEPFYYSGFAGSVISMVSFVIASVYIYKIGLGLTKAKLPAIAGTRCTAHPARRSKAASTKSWLMMWPPNGLRPRSTGSPAASAKARVRITALWPQ